jgi:hypothetical protein
MDAQRFVQGQRLKVELADTQMVRVYWQAVLIGLASVANKTLSPQKVLMNELRAK